MNMIHLRPTMDTRTPRRLSYPLSEVLSLVLQESWPPAMSHHSLVYRTSTSPIGPSYMEGFWHGGLGRRRRCRRKDNRGRSRCLSCRVVRRAAVSIILPKLYFPPSKIHTAICHAHITLRRVDQDYQRFQTLATLYRFSYTNYVAMTYLMLVRRFPPFLYPSHEWAMIHPHSLCSLHM